MTSPCFKLLTSNMIISPLGVFKVRVGPEALFLENAARLFNDFILSKEGQGMLKGMQRNR
jgi:hypothetical protein